jgi:hypothetical protein
MLITASRKAQVLWEILDTVLLSGGQSPDYIRCLVLLLHTPFLCGLHSPMRDLVTSLPRWVERAAA